MKNSKKTKGCFSIFLLCVIILCLFSILTPTEVEEKHDKPSNFYTLLMNPEIPKDDASNAVKERYFKENAFLDRICINNIKDFNNNDVIFISGGYGIYCERDESLRNIKMQEAYDLAMNISHQSKFFDEKRSIKEITYLRIEDGKSSVIYTNFHNTSYIIKSSDSLYIEAGRTYDYHMNRNKYHKKMKNELFFNDDIVNELLNVKEFDNVSPEYFADEK